MTTLSLSKLTCNRKRDVTGEDEIEIWLDSHLNWNNTIKKNQSRDLSLHQDFIHSIAVEIKERNPNSAKSLGTRTIESHNPGQGPIDFNPLYRLRASLQRHLNTNQRWEPLI